MKQATLIKISAILSYVIAFVYDLVMTYCFALDNPLYWLFLVLGLVSLYAGLGAAALNRKHPWGKKERILFIVVTGCSIVSVIPLVLNLMVLFTKDISAQPLEERESPIEKPLPVEAKSKAWWKKANFITFLVSFFVIAAASFSAQLFETSGYSVSVSDFSLTRANSKKYTSIPLNGKTHTIDRVETSYACTVYKPKSATKENPAPCIIVMPGFTRTKATMAQYAIEYSKRGAVVFTIDPGCQGDTTYAGYDYDSEGHLIVDNNGNPVPLSSTIGANGLYYLTHYIYENTDDYPYIDRSRIGCIGHSAGGGNVISAAAEFAGSDYASSVFKAVYCSGYIKLSAANLYSKLHCNAANAYAYYDEGAFRYKDDLSNLNVVNLRFLNEVAGTSNAYTSVTYDQDYGSMSDGTYRICHHEFTNHAFEMYDKTSIANTVNFFSRSLSFDTTLVDDSFTWMGKETSNGLALAASFVLIVSLSSVLLSLPFLRSLKAKEAVVVEEKANATVSVIPARHSFTHQAILWGTSVLSAIIACLDYIPLAWLSIHWFPDAANNVYTFFFPARMFNAVLLWGSINGLIGLVLFFGTILIENLVEYFAAIKDGREPHYDWSRFQALKIKPLDLLKTLFFAFALFGFYYLAVQLSYWAFHQDFRFMLISAEPLTLRYFVTWLEYIPFLLIFYFSNSIKVNCSYGLEGWKEWKVLLVGAISNSIGLAFILLIQYVSFFKTGVPYYGYWGNDNQEVWLYVNMVFSLTVMMALLPVMNRLFYKQTHRVYLGALVNVMIFVMMGLAASVSYIRM